MHSTSTIQVISNPQDFSQLVIVIALSFLIMSSFFIVIIVNVYRQRVKSQKKILDAIYNAQENEKTRIAEDLHDNIGASLSALKLRIEAISEDSTDAKSSALAKESNQLLDTVIGDLRIIVRNQASKYLINNGFNNELNRFKNQFSSNKKINFQFTVSEHLPSLDNSLGVNLFRIIQELVNNSVKHSNCTSIVLSIFKSENKIVMKYEDNGKGFDPEEENQKGMGLSNINARVKLFNGKYEVESLKGTKTSYEFIFDASFAE